MLSERMLGVLVAKLNQMAECKREIEALGAKVTLSIMTPMAMNTLSPGFYSVRVAGKCPHCRERSLISYLVKGFEKRNNGTERCQVHCVECGFANEGERGTGEPHGGEQ